MLGETEHEIVAEGGVRERAGVPDRMREGHTHVRSVGLESSELGRIVGEPGQIGGGDQVRRLPRRMLTHETRNLLIEGQHFPVESVVRRRDEAWELRVEPVGGRGLATGHENGGAVLDGQSDDL